MDSGQEVARYVQAFLTSRDMLCDAQQDTKCEFYVSDAVEGFIPTAELFLGDNIARQVQHVEVDTL